MTEAELKINRTIDSLLGPLMSALHSNEEAFAAIALIAQTDSAGALAGVRRIAEQALGINEVAKLVILARMGAVR